ncbi:MAG: aminopeptidase P family protein, partial [Bacilli bacterium]
MRKQLIINKLIQEQLDYIIIFDLANIEYYTNFSGSNGLLLVTKAQLILFSDFRYTKQIKDEVDPSITYLERNRSLLVESLMEYLAPLKDKLIGVDPSLMSYQQALLLQEYPSTLINISINYLRITKEKDEIDKIRKACWIGDQIFKELLTHIKVGISEKELLKELIKIELNYESDGFSFDPIIVSGYRGGLPHGKPNSKVIGLNEFVTIDIGVLYQNYSSDMTRTVFVGDVINDLALLVYQTTLKAQLASLQALTLNIPLKD